ncbi:beta-galactosidase-like [Dendronephthya gigantea]|uniref:beta-galactosidase-like n=1 Tax=Dendronephthya gigantea TaxID=151771 RepID=UPI00106B3032|nr:beta-galactosidase-like [Dendronephthya gigantea]
MRLSTIIFYAIIPLFVVHLELALCRSFTIDYERDCFLKDGKEFRYISGGFHYFRAPRFYWKDRLLKIKASGLNAVQSYVPWNIHEPTPGHYNFDGDADLLAFIQLIKETGLLMVLRPGPYICSEWDFGGLPAWLLKNQSIVIRSSHDKTYMDAVTSWMTVLLGKIKPFLYVNGGPIISVQVENEYGIYPICDHDYMKYLQGLFEDVLGKDVILFTTNPAVTRVMECGTIPTLFNTVDFGPGDNVTAAFEVMRKYQPHGPLVNSEFYTGWLDNWGKPHQTRSSEVVAGMLDDILKRNASVNMYMFFGGTNFGFMNGANYNYHPDRYQAQPTSYDYDAPLSEAGDITDKYHAVRNVIGKYLPIPPGPIPPSGPKQAYGKVTMEQVISLQEILNDFTIFSWTKSKYPISMEQLGYYYGFVVYKTVISLQNVATLNVPGIRDRGVVYCDRKRLGIIDRNGHTELKIEDDSCKNLMILVENEGRINAGSKMIDPKGIIKNVTLNKQTLLNWEVAPFLPMTHAESRKIESFDEKDPSGVYAGSIVQPIKAPKDSYLMLKGWNKGQVYINGFNLGRYWPVEGPQITLYVPANVLRADSHNNIVVLEMDKAPCLTQSSCFVEFVTTPILNGTVPSVYH